MLKHVRERMQLGASRTRHGAMVGTALGSSAQQVYKVVEDLRQQIGTKIYVDGKKGKPKHLPKLGEKERVKGRVYEEDVVPLEELYEDATNHMSSFVNERYAEQVKKWFSEIGGSSTQLTELKSLGIKTTGVTGAIGISSMTGGWGAKRTSKAKAHSVNSKFSGRFTRVLKKFSDDDERDLFKSAFDAWMSLSTSSTGMKVKTFLKKHGEAGIRLMGKAFVKPAKGEDLSKVTALELGTRVMKSKRLNRIVRDAGESNPASMRGLMEQQATSTVRAILANPSSVPAPPTESHEDQVASLEAIGLMEPADKPLPSADDAADVDLLPAAPKKGKPKAAERGPFGLKRWFSEEDPTEADGLSVLHSIMGGDHSRDKT